MAMNLHEAIKDFEKKHILYVLVLCGWNRKAAAKELGIGISTLYRKIIELGIERK